MKKPTREFARPQQQRRLEVFVSYAKEDAQLVNDLTEEISRVFNSFQVDFFVDKRSINDGDNFRAKIDDRLDSADILLIISTGRQKESHDFPGFEVGFFTHSLKARPTVGGMKRQIIPLIIGGKTPTAISDIQGVIIQPKQIFKFEVAPGELSSQDKFLQSLSADNPFRKLLAHLLDIIAAMSSIQLGSDDLRRWDKIIDERADQIYKLVFAYLQGRIYSESYPERKLIIRTPLLQSPAADAAILADSTIEFVGRSFESLGLPEQPSEFSWPAFVSAIGQNKNFMQWQEAIRTLVTDALSGVPTDNYYRVSSPAAEQSFRLFVSLTRTYYSGKREIHIYIVAIPEQAKFGDPKTTRLMKAVDLGLRYRSMFLENGSPFSPDFMAFWNSKELKSNATKLWNELQHILAEARQDGLDNPQLLRDVYGAKGHERVDELIGVWAKAEANLNKITHEIAAAEEGKVDAMKSHFMAGLREFCDKTEAMNQEFTSKALQALEAEITRKFAASSGGTPAPPKAAGA